MYVSDVPTSASNLGPTHIIFKKEKQKANEYCLSRKKEDMREEYKKEMI